MDLISILKVGYNANKTNLLFSQRRDNDQILMAGAISLTGYQATIAVILICYISMNEWQWFIIKLQFQFLDYAAILEIKKYNSEFNILM